jgi:hypothetical protein
MKRIVMAGLFVGAALGQSLANEMTERIIVLSEDKRNEFWTLYLQRSGRKCDVAVRSMFQGGSDDGQDSWSVACRDGGSYSVGIAAGPEGATTLMTCDDLAATEAVLLKLSGSKFDAAGCWKKFTH